jgi:hypothetical protein
MQSQLTKAAALIGVAIFLSTAVNTNRKFLPEAQPEIRPHPHLPRPKRLQKDFKRQFSELTATLRDCFRDLLSYEAALAVHLESVSARA